jgi:PAS domain S-box-containing protein
MKNLQQLMLDHSPYMAMLVEPSGLRIIVANKVAEQALGYSEEQLLSLCITDIESSLQDVFFWEDVRNGQYQHIETQEGLYRCIDGSLLTVMKSVRVIRDGESCLLLVQARDIRNERQVQEALEHTLSQLRATLEATGDGILVIDWHGRIVNMNRLFSKMWNLPEELMQMRDDAAIHRFLAEHVIEDELCRTRLQEIVNSGETEDIFRLGDGRVFECRSRPQYLNERIVGRVFGFKDITERQRAEAALRESRDELEARVLERTADLRQANATLHAEKLLQEELIRKLEQTQGQLLQSEKMASIGVLAAGVAHEINNPISFVNSNMGTLKEYAQDVLRLLARYEAVETQLPDDAYRDIQRFKEEIDAAYIREDLDVLIAESLDGLERVRRIVQDMRNFAHVDKGERQLADLEGGLDSTLNVVWNELKYKAEVIKEYGRIPHVECVQSQLNQVFMNLLINAAHAIEDHGRITVRTGHDNEYVWVEIEDTGGGIQPEHLGRIFEPFFTTKSIGKGTGLGLSLSYGIVQKHGGRIDVKSQEGRGSIFKVILPRRVKENPAAEKGMGHTTQV